ncbi:acyltransferase family protein [Arthrobacter sp. zg-Y877]|uniref:acyltransferase family protein n=1 Tax=Arthrobacter sp. zg-Y877 TaxID=3049074 RepID=UPI0025A38028|nr:acyltransferase family protein [Arthrobacter sp. zg-Y877]MDM7990203.1 acyltransferase family protein [Arthrobacter sp. zg-Y877]
MRAGAGRHLSSGIRGAGPQAHGFRTDIQALRALAVGLVVLNHLWPLRLPGGYVGVDVFFVISGFLITSHLYREIQTSGKIRLAAFYSRRARRLFPAAFLVLAASMLLAVLFLPYPRWITTAQEVLASVFYVENWLLAAKSVDYSAMTESASAVQHYWSLSVEEQFYLFWPLAIVLFAFLARWLRMSMRYVLLAGVFAVAAVSLTASIYLTAVTPAQAYFATPARVWEFAAGALIALAGVRLASLKLSSLLAIAGFALILASALAYDGQTPFPGWTAVVPVAGTALVIVAGTGGGRLSHNRLTASAPVQFFGKISYSLYLWHWPLIVAAPFALGVVPTAPYKLAVLAAAVLLSWVTKKWVEDRWITRPGGRRSKVREHGFGRALCGMLAVAAVAGLLAGSGAVKERQAVELAATGAAGPCYGPAAIDNRDCGDPFSAPVAMPHMGVENEYGRLPAECGKPKDMLLEGGGPSSCDFSGGNPEAEVVWVAGDSHAVQWMAPIAAIAQERGWMLKWSNAAGCPLVEASIVSIRGEPVPTDAAEHCRRWNRALVDAVEADKPDRVFVAMFAAAEHIDDGSGQSQTDQYARGLALDWKRWVDVGITVIPVTDPPLNGSVRSLDCLALNAATPTACAVPRDQALGINPFVEAAAMVDSPSVRPLDLTDYFCDLHKCYSAVGGVSVYFDADHLNAQYAQALAGHFTAVLD